ncbi:MAG: hypothetical protein HZT42_00030 [Paracoccaceae bacterium]|nr:MAG: hypothetical protein HZT42_00030 [Paracoccaceae bacterium]
MIIFSIDQVTVEEVTERPLFAKTEAESLVVTRSVMKRTVSHEDPLYRFTLNDSPSPLFELDQ